MKKRTILTSLAALFFVGALLFGFNNSYKEALADNFVQGSYINVTQVNSGNYYFTMAENDAPFSDSWSIRYKPESVENITITQPDGTSYHIESAITQREAICKYSATNYSFEKWVFGNTRKPEVGDTVTIEGNFIRVDDGVTTKLNIKKSSFTIEKDSNDALYAVNLPQHIYDVNELSTGFSMGATWWFLFNINGLSGDYAPFSDDNHGYMPANKNCILLDGEPIAKVGKQAIRRRNDDVGSYQFYVVKQQEGQNFEPAMGQVVVFDGLFIFNGSVNGYETNERLGLTFSLLAFERVGTGVNDYRIIDLKQHLSDKLTNKYNINLFKEEDKEEVQQLISMFVQEMEESDTATEIYQVYNNYSLELSGFEYDPETTKELLEQYVNLDNYFEDEQAEILAIIADAKTAIDEVLDNSEISEIYELAKAEIDLIKTKVEVMVNAIEGQSAGFEDYLASYDTVSLSSLNLGDEVVYHYYDVVEDVNARTDGLNTNATEQQLNNSFVPSSGNQNGNVVFKFKYVPNAVPVRGANLAVNVRGIPYYGYKFGIDTNSRGCFAEALGGANSSAWYPGEGNLFENGQEYIVEVGAIDLLNDVDMTWMYIKVDGVLAFNKVVKTLLIGDNPRVSLSPNDDKTNENHYEGEIAIYNVYEGLSEHESTYCGAFTYNENQEVSTQSIKLKLDRNNIPTNINAYPLNESAVKLIRNDATTNIAKTDVALINKLSETDYQLDLSNIVEVQDEDVIVIDGDFVYYSDDTKYAFTIAPSRYKYHESDNSWEVILTLEETKVDAKNRLDHYADLSSYDEDEQLAINQIISEAKTNIDNAETIQAVKDILETAKTQIDAVKTSLQKYKETCAAIVNNYKNDELNNYRNAEKEDIASLKREAVEDISDASTKEEIDLIVVNLKLDIDDLKTDAEYQAEELNEAKSSGSARVKNHYASLDLSKYSQEEKAALDSDTSKALSDIKAATSIEEVNRIVETYIQNHQQKGESNNSQSKKCGGDIMTTSIILSSIALVGIGFILTNKRKELE